VYGAPAPRATPITNVVALSAILAAPDPFRDKGVSYTDVYQNVGGADQRGGKNPNPMGDDKWFVLEIGNPQLPVFFRKSEANRSFLAMLKPGTRVRVTGRVKAYPKGMKRAVTSEYYVEAHRIVPETDGAPTGGGGWEGRQ
jgi:hypothetical protein